MNHDDWFQTATGGIFPVEGFGPADIKIEDIARSLASQCRFTGHLKAGAWYSVAQHSVLASRLVPGEHMLWALLHDSAETYLADVPAPFKSMLPDYLALEKRIMLEVCNRFGLPNKKPLDVKQADLKMLATERRDLLVPAPQEWASLEGIVPDAIRIEPWSWQMAEQRFLVEFYRLWK